MAVTETRADRLLATGLALAAELSLPSLLQRIVEQAVELTGARYGALGVLSPEGDRLSDFVTTGMTAQERAAIGDLPRGRGILGVLIHDAAPLRLADISHDPRSVGFPPNHPPMRSFLGVPVRAHGQVFGNVYLCDKQGAPEFTEEDEAALTVLATQAGVAVANARLYQEVQVRERWLAALSEVATLLLAGEPGRRVLELLARRSRELTDADVATISVPAGAALRIAVADGAHAIDLMDLEVPLSGSLSAQVIASGQPLAVDDARTAGVKQPMARIASVGAMMLVPLQLRGGSSGVLAVGRVQGREGFAAAELPLLQRFADQAAVALEYAAAQADVARLSMVEDRERIARELHDGVIQSLFAVGLGLQGTAAVVGDSRLADRIQQAVGEIDRVIGDLRSYIFGLKPSVLSAGSLTDALEQLAHEFQERTGVTIVVDVDASLEAVLGHRSTDVAQIVREALSNMGRHAGAETCRVSLRREADIGVIEVDDDGRGFDLDSAPRGMGLRNLAERAEKMGGTLDVITAPRQGTTIRVNLPF